MMTNACKGAVRFFSIFALTAILIFGGCQNGSATGKPEPVVQAEKSDPPSPEKPKTIGIPEELPKTPPPPQPPYKLTDNGAIEIDQATDRLRSFIPESEEVKKNLTVQQVRLAECDKGESKAEECSPRITAMYCMFVGDHHMILKQYEDAKAFFLEAMARTLKQYEILESDYKTFKAEYDKTPPGEGDKAHTYALTGAYNAGKFHFHAYKDYAEMARYQKRLVEVFISMGLDKSKIAEQWEIIANSIKTAAKHHKEFKANVMKMDGIKAKLPSKYMVYYKEIAALAATQRIEPR